MDKIKIKNAILRAYYKDPTVVDDDASLLAAVWGYLGWDNTKSLYSNLERLPRPESISRCRRKLFADGIITYSEKATNKRYEAFKKEREYHGGLSWLKRFF